MRDIIVMALKEEAPSLFEQYSNVFEIGIGKVNAAINTMRLIYKYGPVRVINLGTAGGLTVGTGIYRINKVFQHDMNCIAMGVKPGQIPYDDNSVIELPGNGKICASGDLFVTEPNKLRLNTDIIEMEAYSVAKACLLTQTEVEIYKYITDVADENAVDNWRQQVSNGQLLYKHILNELEVKLEEIKK